MILAAVVSAPLARRAYNRWSAVPAEVSAAMPGDDQVPFPQMTSTRALTIDAAPDEVWAWLVQIGQGRGGFYSFDSLENLVGCHIHSATAIDPELQDLRAGDIVRLAPGQAPCYRVTLVDPPRSLVLVSADPKTHLVSPTPTGPGQLAASWQWTLRPLGDGNQTRLVARQRYSYPRSQSILWHLVEPIDFVMERRMLLGIKHRAEGARDP